ncbi:MAG: DsbA family protein [Solirubrobacteraceae bacterium]
MTAARGELRASGPVIFWFDPASPWTYLAAERVERLFEAVRWRPVAGPRLSGDEECAAVERRARELRMPLVWPEGAGSGIASARVAQLAAEHGCAAAFVLATGRLAYCGGYDVDDPEILAEAAAAAGLGFEEALAAAGDRDRDGELERDARALAARGAESLPALLVGPHLFGGEHRIPGAAAAHADLRGAERSRLVPTRGSQ